MSNAGHQGYRLLIAKSTEHAEKAFFILCEPYGEMRVIAKKRT